MLSLYNAVNGMDYRDASELKIVTPENAIACAKICGEKAVCKKLQKGRAAERIAEELEVKVEVIKNICEKAAAYAPGYDDESVYMACRKQILAAGNKLVTVLILERLSG